LWISRHGDVEVLLEGNELVGRDLAKKLEGRVGWRTGRVVAYLASPDKYAVSDRERERERKREGEKERGRERERERKREGEKERVFVVWLPRQVCGL